MVLMVNSGARGTLIYEKNLMSKISCQTPFKVLNYKEKSLKPCPYTTYLIFFFFLLHTVPTVQRDHTNINMEIYMYMGIKHCAYCTYTVWMG
jgi:hypothetical protein